MEIDDIIARHKREFAEIVVAVAVTIFGLLALLSALYGGLMR